MFCTSCGSKQQEGSAFCAGCGAKIGEGIPPTQVTIPPVAMHQQVASTIMVRDFRCNGCGAPLKIPPNSSASVKCPSCKTECVVERLIKNAEMAAKENIASGVPLTATPAMLHHKLVSLISESPNIPADIFEKGEVIREEHHCVPAFYFYCNGSASYTYEAGTEKVRDGNSRVTSNWLDNGTTTTTERIRYIEWSPMSGTTNASGEVVASGNKEFGKVVGELYMFLDNSKLYDFSELEFPSDVITHEFNTPQTAAFNDYAKTYFENLLEANAEKALSSKCTKNLEMGGSRIDKDEVIRIFLGIYCIVFLYEGKEYAICVSGDASKAISGGMPEDRRQKETVENNEQKMEKEIAAVPVPKGWKYTLGGVGLGLLGFLIFASANLVIALIVFIGLFGGPAVIFKGSAMNKYKEKCEAIRKKHQKEINNMDSQWSTITQQFRNQMKPMRGIYENKVSGNPDVF